MSQENAPAEGEGSAADDDCMFDMEFVDALPGGKAVMALEEKGKLTLCLVRGHVSPQARNEMVADLNSIVRSGLWPQHGQPPQAE